MSTVQDSPHQDLTEVRKIVRCFDCKNLIRIYVDSAFAWFEEKKKCKVKNVAFNGYDEVVKERDCKHHEGRQA